MKKTITFLLAAILMMACNDAVQMPAPNSTTHSSKRTKAQAIELAQAIMDRQGPTSRTGAPLAVANVDALTRANSRSAADTLIYVVNFADDNGFVLVSASTAGEPIIGFSDTGNCNADNAIADDTPFSYYLDAACDYVASTAGIGDEPIPNPNGPVETQYTIRPRLLTEWGTSYPEGMYYANGKCSSLTTAMAQMMTFLKHPSSIELTYPGHDIDVQQLDWSSIDRHWVSVDKNDILHPTNVEDHLSSCPASLEAHQAIGRLCRQLGYLNSDNGNSLSVIQLSKARKTFVNLFAENKVSAYVAYASDIALYSVLENPNAVILMYGTANVSVGNNMVSEEVHAWVCDGAIRVRLTWNVPDIDGNIVTTIRDTYYFHFNWGEKGQCDGFFLAGVFNPSTPYVPSRSFADNDYCNGVKYLSVEKM